MHTTFGEYVIRLRKKLTGPLPGATAQLTMAPGYLQNASLASVVAKPCREASVLAMVFPVEEVPTILLTLQRADLNQHAGQVSFPGGQREPGEELVETALREAREEVGLDTDTIEILGGLTPLFVPPSNFCIHPFVGAISHAPKLTPCYEEVEQLLFISFPLLLDPNTRRREVWTINDSEVSIPFFSVQNQKVWGATAMVLAEWLALWSL